MPPFPLIPIPHHLPVLWKQILNHVSSLKLNRIRIADCTFGLGGHSRLILKQFKGAQIDAFEIDPTTYNHYITNIHPHLSPQQVSRLNIIQSSYANIKQFGRGNYDYVLADLGYNSLQIDNGQRGFSWLNDGPLDMRFNNQQGRTCQQILSNLSPLQLSSLLTLHSSLAPPLALSIATAIHQAKPITTTSQLRKIVQQAWIGEGQGAKGLARIFQTLRILVNSEMAHISMLKVR